MRQPGRWPRSCSSPGWPRSPKLSPDSANLSSTPPRPPPHYAPLSGSTPPPARRWHRHPAQRHAPAPPPSSPGCPFPHQPGLPHDHPHPDSPALIQTAPGHHAGHHRHSHAAPAPDRAARTTGWTSAASVRHLKQPQPSPLSQQPPHSSSLRTNRMRGLDGLAQRSDAVRKKAQLFELGSNSWR